MSGVNAMLVKDEEYVSAYSVSIKNEAYSYAI